MIVCHKVEHEDYNELIFEYKAKGENMLNIECKQCHKKWHHDNAKYCSACGKKLVAEPEFKVGDYVSVVTDGTKKITKISDRETHITHGLWYDESKNIVKQDFWYLGKSAGASATPEEIAEYKVALNFHKNGRKPFEVKKGDILKDDEGTIFFVDFPSNWKKESFTSGRYTFLKTAEEFNEWIGADDE